MPNFIGSENKSAAVNAAPIHQVCGRDGRTEGVAMLRFLALSLAFVLFVALAPMASAQNQPAPAPASAPAQDLLQPGQIDALVAPIALYSDTLLAEVLMASTYPL